MRKKCHILLSADENYLMQAVVSINSIIISNKDLKLEFHVLYSKISDDAKEKVSKWMEIQYSGTDIFFHRVREENYIFPIREGDAVSIETYFRILAPDILPLDIKRILYVDCDTVTIGSIRDLFDMDLEGYALGCALGMAEESRKLFLGLKSKDPYFQAGVMLMNLEYWREHRVGEKVLEFIQKNRDNLPRHEQDAMNAVLAGKYLLLEQKWNTCLGAAPRDKKFENDPVILHYTGYHRYKPWWKNTLSRWQDVYLRYRAGTPYESVALEWCEQYQYEFDRKKIPKSSRIVLYAAGEVGTDFYEQNQKKAFCEIIAWVDKNYQKFENSQYPVQNLQVLWKYQYDFILIAVKQEEIAREIQRELQEAGINQEKLIWLEP